MLSGIGFHPALIASQRLERLNFQNPINSKMSYFFRLMETLVTNCCLAAFKDILRLTGICLVQFL
jgi:hypothetical protein